MLVRARAPLRLGLAGGGTDVSPYCDQFGGYVLNATIDRYAYTVIRLLNEPVIRFVAADQKLAWEGNLAKKIPLDNNLPLHKAVYNEIIRLYNNNSPIALEINTFCDAPSGSGLGSSSTLVVSMIKAFVELLNLPLDDYTIANIAFKVERMDCGFQGGRQDQYSATFGGFNFMEFNANEHAIVNSLRVKNWIVCELEASLILFYTGISRESAKIIKDQSRNMIAGDADKIESFHGIKREALQMKESLLKGDFNGIVKSMLQGWKNKKESAKTVSNPHIDELYNVAMNSGACAGKVSGAGGGGFLMFFVPPECRMDVIHALNRYEGQLSNVHFTLHGAQAWKIL